MNAADCGRLPFRLFLRNPPTDLLCNFIWLWSCPTAFTGDNELAGLIGTGNATTSPKETWDFPWGCTKTSGSHHSGNILGWIKLKKMFKLIFFPSSLGLFPLKGTIRDPKREQSRYWAGSNSRILCPRHKWTATLCLGLWNNSDRYQNQQFILVRGDIVKTESNNINDDSPTHHDVSSTTQSTM